MRFDVVHHTREFFKIILHYIVIYAHLSQWAATKLSVICTMMIMDICPLSKNLIKSVYSVYMIHVLNPFDLLWQTLSKVLRESLLKQPVYSSVVSFKPILRYKSAYTRFFNLQNNTIVVSNISRIVWWEKDPHCSALSVASGTLASVWHDLDTLPPVVAVSLAVWLWRR